MIGARGSRLREVGTRARARDRGAARHAGLPRPARARGQGLAARPEAAAAAGLLTAPGRGAVGVQSRTIGTIPHDPSHRRARMAGVAAGFRTKLYRDDAVVLRVQKLGESDRIITLLTRRHGRVVRAVAKGVRRTTSRFGARLEPFGHVDVQIAEGRQHACTRQPGRGHRAVRQAGSPTTTRATRRPARSRRPPSGSPRSSRSRRCGCSS